MQAKDSYYRQFLYSKSKLAATDEEEQALDLTELDRFRYSARQLFGYLSL